MSSNFERFPAIINHANYENMWTFKICQEPPNQGQNDLVLFPKINFGKKLPRGVKGRPAESR